MNKCYIFSFMTLFCIVLSLSTVHIHAFFNFSKYVPEATMLPPLIEYVARDGQALSYRVYTSINTQNVIVLLHGSSYHGAYLHALARYLSDNNVGTVCVPNIRGHYKSGLIRGDCAYVGQLEDDIVDLINHRGWCDKNIYLCGHSSGGGLAIRFAGSKYRGLVKGFILISPAIPTAPTMRNGDAGGWADVYLWRLRTLTIINEFGISCLNHIPVIRFNQVPEFCDGTETLTYSYNLNTSYHPRILPSYRTDIVHLNNNYIILVGQHDEANDPSQYTQVFTESQVSNKIIVMPDLNHMDIVADLGTMKRIHAWIEEQDCKSGTK